MMIMRSKKDENGETFSATILERLEFNEHKHSSQGFMLNLGTDYTVQSLADERMFTLEVRGSPLIFGFNR